MKNNKRLLILALSVGFTQALCASNFQTLTGGQELLAAAKTGIAAVPEVASKPAIISPAENRTYLLNNILAERGAAVKAGDNTTNTEILINYLRTPAAAEALRSETKLNTANRFAALDAVWALGELKNAAAYDTLENLLLSADYTASLNIQTALNKISSVSPEKNIKFKKPDFSKITPGDILFRKGIFGIVSQSLPVGHTAIFTGMEDGTPMVIHATGWRDVCHADMTEFIADETYYGNRTTPVPPTAEQRKGILAWLEKQIGKPFDLFHTTQKGPDTFDCVGLTESAYESVGLNPTPDKLEYPLEPHDQYDHTVPN